MAIAPAIEKQDSLETLDAQHVQSISAKPCKTGRWHAHPAFQLSIRDPPGNSPRVNITSNTTTSRYKVEVGGKAPVADAEEEQEEELAAASSSFLAKQEAELSPVFPNGPDMEASSETPK